MYPLIKKLELLRIPVEIVYKYGGVSNSITMAIENVGTIGSIADGFLVFHSQENGWKIWLRAYKVMRINVKLDMLAERGWNKEKFIKILDTPNKEVKNA